MVSRRNSVLWFAVIALLAVLWGSELLRAVQQAPFSGDEGWYAQAAVRVRQGYLPYRDFMFTQAPLMPSLYAAWSVIFGRGIRTGRFLSALFALLGLVVVAVGVNRHGGRFGLLLVLILYVGNRAVIGDLAAVKSQALTSALLAILAFFLLRQPSRQTVFAAGLATGLLVVTRLSTAVLIPLLLLAAPGMLRTSVRRVIVPFCLGLLPGVLLLLPFLLSDPANLWFGIYGIHRQPQTGVGAARILWLGRFMSGFAQRQIVLLAIGLSGVIGCWWRRRTRFFDGAAIRLSVAYLAVTAVHIAAPAPYPIHQVSLWPLGVAAASIWLSSAVQDSGKQLIMAVAVVMLSIVCLPFQSQPLRPEGARSLALVEKTAARLLALADRDRSLITFAPELAVESGLQLAPGYEMGRYALLLRLDPQQAVRHHVIEFQRLRNDIATQSASVLALPQSFTASLPLAYRIPLQLTLQECYREAGAVQGYGQFSEKLLLYRKQTGDHSAAP